MKYFALIACIFFLCVIDVHAEIITVGSVEAHPGETVFIPITVDVPENIAGAVFTLTYNSSYFTLDDVQSSFFTTFTNQWQSFDPPPDPMPAGQVTIDNVEYTSPLLFNVETDRVLIAAARVNAGLNETTLFTLQLTVKADAPNVRSPLSVSATSINNTEAGYPVEGELVPMLIGIVEGEQDPSFAYPVLPAAVVNGEIVINTVPVGNLPEVFINSPLPGSIYGVGDSVVFSGTATDLEDGDLGNQIAWSSSINGALGTGPSFNRFLSAGTHSITASVTDSATQTNSDSVTITVTSDNTPGIDFNQAETVGYSNQDRVGTVTVEDNGATLALTGNRWVKTVQYYDITPETVIEFDFKSTIEGEIHGIGFDEDDELINNKRIFQFFGTSVWGDSFQNDQQYQQTDLGEWVHFTIPIGQYYTGSNMNLVFVNDHDKSPANGTGWFSNVNVSAVVAELDYIAIEGEAAVNENGTADYNARAYYTNGSSKLVEPSWDINCPLLAQISTTGVLMTYEVTQDEPCTVEAFYEEDGLTETAELQLIISDGVAPPAELIIDNSDSETSSTGDWPASGGLDYYGTKSVYSKTIGSTYRYEASLNGYYELSLWWTQWSSRCRNVSVEIYDGTTLLDTLIVNQQTNGGQWNVRGSYGFTGTGAVVIVSQSSACSTNADAVRFISSSPPELQSIAIEGNTVINENSASDFSVVASYTNGSSKSVEPIWNITCPTMAVVSSTGLLTSYEVDQDVNCAVEASYQEEGISRSDSFSITIRDLDSIVPTRMIIDGAAVVSGNSSEQYRALVYLSDISDLFIEPSWSVDCPSVASISSSGLLSTYEVSQLESCTVNASYTMNTVTVNASLAVTFEVATPGIDFNQAETVGYSNQDRVGTVAVEDNGATLALTGNRWVKTVQYYDVTPETVIEFDFKATIEGEIHGIGFDEDDELTNNKRIFQFFGTSVWGDAFQYDLQYQQSDLGEWVHFTIPIGQYYTGSNMNLVFVNDHDKSPANGTGWFSNVNVSAVVAELDYIAIEGEAAVNENGTADYNARVYYTNGSSKLVEPSWDISCSLLAEISTTGLLTTYEVTQDEPCTVEAFYEEGVLTETAELQLIISDGVAPPEELIIDNGDSETSSAGDWPASGGFDYYGTKSVYSKTIGSTYRYQASLNGDYELSLWWTEWPSRCTNVSVKIYDGTTLLDTLTVNQQTNGGQWNVQGSYGFTGTGAAVIVSQGGACSTNADAVRLIETP